MQQLTLHICLEDNKLVSLLDLLRSLNYIYTVEPIVKPSKTAKKTAGQKPLKNGSVLGSQPDSEQLKNAHFQSVETEKPQESLPKLHPLAEFAGMWAGPDGDEIAEILQREFQNIDGEWQHFWIQIL